MLYDIIFIISVLGLLFCLTFGRMILKSDTEQCRYHLYKIRDQLILLVATNAISKESIVFKHYYSFVNDLLNFTEQMHFEGLINAILLKKRSKKESQEYHEHFKIVAQELEDSSAEVKAVIVELYQYLGKMMVVNSNLFDVLYKLSKHHKKVAETLQILGISHGSVVNLSNRSSKTEKARKTIEKERQMLGLAV